MIPSVLAHGVGGRTDLPLPVWLFAYAAGFALLISFAVLRILWPRPRLAAASIGRALPAAVQRVRPAVDFVLRTVGLAAFLLTLYAAAFGIDEGATNIAPVAFCVIFWVGMQVVVAAVGDVWRLLNPFDTIAWFLRIPETTARRDPGQWTAALMILAFAWLELAYWGGCSFPRVVAVWLVAYTVAAMAGAVVWGRGWLRTGEGFAALFSLLALISPLHRDPDSGQTRVRWPCSGLSSVPVVPGTTALVFVALGSTGFDGFTRSTYWTSIAGQRTGWDRTVVSSVGLIFVIALVALAYLVATRVTAMVVGADPVETAERFIGSLVPIILAYTVAHYFSLLVFEGQNFIALLSDPFGRGWDLFGTISQTIDYRIISTRTIAYIQVASIVVGHVLGVVVAHDRAVESYDRRLAERSQYALLAVMILYTVAGLGLLLGS